MGVNGCVWVRWGAEGTGDTKTRQEGLIQGLAGQDLTPMAGKISPDIMFWRVWQKVVWRGANRCRSVRMAADRCMDTGGKQKQGKKSPKWAGRGCFVMYAHSAKKQEVGSDGHADQRGSFVGIEGKKDVCGTV